MLQFVTYSLTLFFGSGHSEQFWTKKTTQSGGFCLCVVLCSQLENAANHGSGSNVGDGMQFEFAEQNEEHDGQPDGREIEG